MAPYIDIRTAAKSGDETLFLLRLPLDRPGFEEFLGSWLRLSPRETVLVDCGVTGSYPALKKALDELGAKPDLLLLTHVHLDHSGAAGCLTRDFPSMRVFSFERAARHLIAPEKLWNATAATLGEATAAAYQPPLPVPADRIIPRGELGAEWTVLDTPGHATHHVSFIRDFAGTRVCFGGEALGVVAGLDVTSWFADHVRRDGIRPATPPKYVPEIGRNSMKLLGAQKWDLYCSGHFGSVPRGDIVERSLAQNEFWEKKIAQAMRDGLSETEMVSMMMRDDPELADISFYDDANKAREVYFLGNSVRGFVKFFQEQAAAQQ